MISSAPIEVWVIMQVVMDLCLIILFIILVRQLRAASRKAKFSWMEKVSNAVEPVLIETQKVAKQFEAQLKTKQRIARKLNERLDNRIISLNLLLNRTDACLASGENISSDVSSFHSDFYGSQHEVMTLAEKGFDPENIANRLGISKGEVALVLDLKKKFSEMEQG